MFVITSVCYSNNKMIFKLDYASFHTVLCLKYFITLVISLFCISLYYGMFRYKTDKKIRKQPQYSVLNPVYALVPTIVITILAFGICYFMWNGTIFSWPEYLNEKLGCSIPIE